MQLQAEVSGRGYPIVCLHGHPGNRRCMRVFTDGLSRQFRTIAPDLRGYGQSRTTTPFVMTDHLTDLVELLETLAIHNCIILGWSLGGIIAMEMAWRYPHRVAGLILLGTAARPQGNHPPISWQDNAFTAIASLINRISPGERWHIEAFGKRSLYRYLIQQHTPEAYQRLADDALPAFLQTSKPAQVALNQALQQGYNRLAELKKITVPSLVLCGECDRHITAVASQQTARALPNSTLKTYPATAHLFPWEIPTQVLSDICSWLSIHFPEQVNQVRGSA